VPSVSGVWPYGIRKTSVQLSGIVSAATRKTYVPGGNVVVVVASDVLVGAAVVVVDGAVVEVAIVVVEAPRPQATKSRATSMAARRAEGIWRIYR
jgi:hypothetical protein